MPGYLLKQERIAVQGADDLTIRSLLNRQQFSDPHGVAERLGISSASWPLFGLLWPSGAHLAAALAVRTLTPGERVLELGCGLGLASLVAHRRGIDVTASDCHPLASAFLQENLRLNQLPPMKYLHGQWGPGPARAIMAPTTAAQRVADPAAASGQFDFIMASDVLYERDPLGDLAAFIAERCAPTAEVCIVDPNRGNRSAFSQRMVALGFTLDEVRLDVPEALGVPAYRGRMLHYRRTAARWQ